MLCQNNNQLLSPVLADLQSACLEYQHLQCGKTHTFLPCFSEKTAIFAAEKDPFAMKATANIGDCKSPYSTPANCKFAGTGK